MGQGNLSRHWSQHGWTTDVVQGAAVCVNGCATRKTEGDVERRNAERRWVEQF